MAPTPELLRRCCAPATAWIARRTRTGRCSGWRRSARCRLRTSRVRSSWPSACRRALDAALLGETEASVTDIAYQTGWQSIGTFGRVFRDVTGDSPGERRGRERQADAGREAIPECLLRAARRPDLKTAVLEKRRKAATGKNGPPSPEAT